MTIQMAIPDLVCECTVTLKYCLIVSVMFRLGGDDVYLWWLKFISKTPRLSYNSTMFSALLQANHVLMPLK